MISTSINEENNSIVFKVGEQTCELMFGQLAESVQDRATTHGLVQRVSDMGALKKGASEEEKFARINRLVEHYNSGGAWELPRAEGANWLVIAALSEIKQISAAEVRKELEQLAGQKGVKLSEVVKMAGEVGKVGAKMAEIKGRGADLEEGEKMERELGI